MPPVSKGGWHASDHFTEAFPQSSAGGLSRLGQHRDLSEVNKTLVKEAAERKRSEAEKERLIGELRTSLAQIKTLKGLLPICASCKKIRDDKGYWNQIENYIKEHSDAEFSHAICPDCAKKLYPDIFDRET